MAWHNSLNKGAPVERKSSTMALGMNDALGSFMMFGSGKGASASSALQLYRDSSAVSIPINRIAAAIAALRLTVVDREGIVVANHPVLELLNKPSPYFTKALFMQTIATNFLITGELQVVGIGGISTPPIELQPISPDKCILPEGFGGLPASITVTGNTMPGAYIPQRAGKDIRYYRDGLSEIYMARAFKTRDNSLLRGESLLNSASAEIRQHILGGIHNISLLEKGGKVSMIFHFKEDMSDADFQTAKERVREQYGGASKAGSIGVTAGDGSLEINQIGNSNSDMDFANLQKMAKIAIANQYGFPLILLDTDAATENNYGNAKEALYDDAVIPFADVILGSLGDFLLPRFGKNTEGLRISMDLDAIPALVMRRNRELKLRKEIGIESTNELREGLPGRDDVDGGGSVMVPANVIPIEQAASEPTPPENPSVIPAVPVVEDDDG